MAVQHKATIGGTLQLAVWLIIAVLLVALTSVPTSVETQAILGASGVALVLLLRGFVRASRFIRLTMLAVASVIVLRYWFWRIFETLPGTEDPVSYAAAVLLFGVETYLIGVFFLSGFLMADPVDHEHPEPMSAHDLPMIDVLIPSLNEPAELLAVTLAAAKNMTYPANRLRVVLCDDGGTDAKCTHRDPVIAMAAQKRRRELRELCDRLGAIYITRFDNRGAKAGNLNSALNTLTGDLVVIFDADHAPTRDFLARTVGYFKDEPKLALVQTPHFFLNSDPVARNLRLAETCPPEQEMFYSLTHKGLDRWGGAFFCGSAAVLRRSALDQIGGISGKTITEDAETAIKLHRRGWRSMYVNRAMIAGLQPETFASFLRQRGRWATGMIQLFMTQNPLVVSGLSLWQRLSYFNSMSYWFFPFVRLVMLIAPLLYLFFGLELFVTTAPEAIAYMASYIAVAYLVQNALFGSVRWPFLSEIYEIAQAPYLLRAVVAGVFAPRRASFNVTSKNETVDQRRVSDVKGPLIMLFLLMLAGCAVLGYRWLNYPGDREVLYIVGAWAIFNTLLVGAALRAIDEPQQRRKAPRIALNVPAIAVLNPTAAKPLVLPAKISDISFGGAQVSVFNRSDSGQAPRGIARGERMMIVPSKAFGFKRAEPIDCRVMNVRSVGGQATVGLAFEAVQSENGYRTIAAMTNGDSTRWLDMRAAQTNHMGLIRGLVHMVVLSVTSILATVSALTRRSDPALAERTAPGASWDGSEAFFGLEDEALAFGWDPDSPEPARAPIPQPAPAPLREPRVDPFSPVAAFAGMPSEPFQSASAMAAATARDLQRPATQWEPDDEFATFRTTRGNGADESAFIKPNGKLS